MNIKEEKIEFQSKLLRLAIRYFKANGYKIKHDATTLEGNRGIQYNFDLVVQKGRLTRAVWVKDWKRTIGVNIIINLDKASEDVGLSNPVIIGEKFSDHAKSYANRRKITLLMKREISRSLR
jgi:hypothetical protein